MTPGLRDIIHHIQFCTILGMIAVSWPTFACESASSQVDAFTDCPQTQSSPRERGPIWLAVSLGHPIHHGLTTV